MMAPRDAFTASGLPRRPGSTLPVDLVALRPFPMGRLGILRRMRLARAGRARLRMAGLATEHHLLPGIQGVFAVVVWVGPFGQISFGDRVVECRVRIAGAHRST